MVLLVQRISLSLKRSTKLENHNHHHHPSEDAFSASLQAFRSDVSNYLFRLLGNWKPGSETMSLKWVHQCFELLRSVSKAFAKLVVEIDYPMSRWEVDSIDEYLHYSLNLLELLNSVTSSLSHIGQARLSLSHALSLIENNFTSLGIERIKVIQPGNLGKDFKLEGIEKIEERLYSGKEWIIHQALLAMKGIGLWVCGVVLSGLRNDSRPYMGMRKSANGFFVDSSLMVALDSKVGKEITEKRGIVKEVKEVNESVACLLLSAKGKGDDYSVAKELQRRLEELDKELKGVGEEVDNLFSEVLVARNELVESLGRKKR